jgi:hypothetical protein
LATELVNQPEGTGASFSDTYRLQPGSQTSVRPQRGLLQPSRNWLGVSVPKRMNCTPPRLGGRTAQAQSALLNRRRVRITRRPNRMNPYQMAQNAGWLAPVWPAGPVSINRKSLICLQLDVRDQAVGVALKMKNLTLG